MNAEGLTNAIMYEDLLTISKKLNTKRNTDGFMRKKSTIISYHNTKNADQSQSKWYSSSKSEKNKTIYESG